MYRVARDQLCRAKDDGGLGLESIKEKCTALLIRNLLFEPKATGGHRNPDPILSIRMKGVEYRAAWEKTQHFSSITAITRAAVIYKDLLQAQGGGNRPVIEQKFPNLRWQWIWRTFARKELPSDWLSALFLYVNDKMSYAAKTFAHGISSSNRFVNCGEVDDRDHRLVACSGTLAYRWCVDELRRLFGWRMTGSEGIGNILGTTGVSGRALTMKWLVAGLVYHNLVRKGVDGASGLRDSLREHRFLLGNGTRRFGNCIYKVQL